MAGGIGSGYRSSGSHRVFVLVDEDAVKGVFFSWDAAEDFADAHGHSLEMLMEYETPGDHPDHLHLMAAKWESGWKFQGEWSQRTLNWQTPPKQVRLEHYHAKGDEFSLFRTWVFDWEPGLLLKVNPMAPDQAFEKISPRQQPSGSGAPAEETRKADKAGESETEKKSPDGDFEPDFPTDSEKEPPKKKSYFQDYDTDFESKEPDINFDDSDALVSDKIDTSPSFPSPVRKLPKIVQRADKLQDTLGTKGLPKREKPPEEKEPSVVEDKPEEPQKVKPKLRLTPTPVPIEDKPEETKPDAPAPAKSRIIKKSTLKLRKKAAPEPIPAFKATSTHGTLAGSKPETKAEQDDADEASKSAKRVWSPKLIFTVVSLVACWIVGLLWALIPEASAESIVAEIATLNQARLIVVEPKMVYFQFDVDPVHQERYIKNLNLKPIPKDEPIPIPTYHALSTWEQVGVYVRPPYANIEVKEWWDIKKRDIQYGFYRQWEDGSILILDFESDTILGWAQAKYLKEILN